MAYKDLLNNQVPARNKDVGDYGEALVCEHLVAEGFTIEVRNFRCAYGEIDIIAAKDGCTSFVEVKTRRGTAFGHPFESVGAKKIQRMKKAIHIYRQDHLVLYAQILVAGVVLRSDGQADIELATYEG